VESRIERGSRRICNAARKLRVFRTLIATVEFVTAVMERIIATFPQPPALCVPIATCGEVVGACSRRRPRQIRRANRAVTTRKVTWLGNELRWKFVAGSRQSAAHHKGRERRTASDTERDPHDSILCRCPSAKRTPPLVGGCDVWSEPGTGTGV